MKKNPASLILVASMALTLTWGGAALAAQLLFTPRVTVTEEYNDNILLDRRDKKDDFITTVTFGGTLELLGQVSGLRLSYDPGYSFYADNDQYDSWEHNLAAAAWHNFSRETRLDLSNYFLYTDDPLAEDVEDDEGEIVFDDSDRRRGLNTYYRNQATARLSHQFGPENSTFVQFTHGLTKYDDPLSEDSQEFSPSAGVTYWFSNWTGVEMGAEYTRGLYDADTSSEFNDYQGRLRLNQRISPRFGLYGEYRHIYRDFDDNDIADGDQDYMVYAPSAGLFYQFDPTLTASLGAGWFYQQIEDADDEDGPFVSANINKLWDFRRGNIRTLAESGIGSDDFGGEGLGFERFAQLGVIGLYNFTRDLFGDCSLRYRYSDYINSEDDQVDHRYTADAGLGYRVTRWMTFRLAYQFNKLDNINGPDDYEQHRAYATITLQPDQPWRLWD